MTQNQQSKPDSEFSRAEGKKWRMLLGDSREKIKEIEEQSVDLILTDPPYNLGKYSTGNIELDWRADFNNDVAEWDQGEFDPKHYLDEFIRVLKPSVFLPLQVIIFLDVGTKFMIQCSTLFNLWFGTKLIRLLNSDELDF